MAVEITPLSPADDVAIAAAHQVVAAADAVDVPDFPAETVQHLADKLRHPWPGTEVYAFLARLDGEPAGLLDLGLPHLDNTHLVEVSLTVHPDLRQRGVGRALYATAVELARGCGRKVLMGQYVTQLPGGIERSPGHAAFAATMGAVGALPEVRRRLDLDTVDTSAWSALREEAQKHASAYSLVSWSGRAPDDVVADVGRLEARMIIDAPIGDLILEPEKYDVARVRNLERVFEARGRRHYHVGARHDASGVLAAWTMISFDRDITAHAWQQTTIVDPEHRGHRLGMLVKLENLQYTVAHEPRLRFVNTWNAEENTHMIAINEAIGFRPVDGWVGWQHEL
jgi:GNAT superfamily N-acetyltransferase